MRLDDAIQHYAEYYLAKVKERSKNASHKGRDYIETESTAKSVLSDLINFQKFVSGKKEVSSINALVINKYLSSQQSRSSAYHRLYSLRKFTKYCIYKGWSNKSTRLSRSLLPSKDILPYREKKCEERPTNKEIQRLISSLQHLPVMDPAGFIVVSLLLSGLKSNEVMELKINHISLKVRGSLITILLTSEKEDQVGMKDGEVVVKTRRIPLTHRVDPVIFLQYFHLYTNRLQEDGSSNLLPFNRNSLSTLFTSICRKARIRSFHPRDLRLLAMLDQKASGLSNKKIASLFGVTKDYIDRELSCG
jgi:integrase